AGFLTALATLLPSALSWAANHATGALHSILGALSEHVGPVAYWVAIGPILYLLIMAGPSRITAATRHVWGWIRDQKTPPAVQLAPLPRSFGLVIALAVVWTSLAAPMV